MTLPHKAPPPAPGDGATSHGRAVRHAGDEAELWRLPDDDARLAARLLRLGAEGIGGFVDGGRDAEGVWLWRRVPTGLLASLLRDIEGEGVGWERARTLVLPLARAARASEAASLFVGAMLPEGIGVDAPTGDAWLLADGFVAALVGADPARRSGTDSGPKSLLWTPPEKLESAQWDNEANRYALGVILYELLAGEHPFGGAGLRHGLAEARAAGAAPFAPEVASTLPPGVQSLCLRLLDPDPARRPAHAAEVVEALEGIGRPSASTVAPLPEPDAPEVQAPASTRPVRRPPEVIDVAWLLRALRPAARYAPAVLALVVLGGAVAYALQSPPPPPRPVATAPTVRALAGGPAMTVQDCASCHPRQADEWAHSVMGHAVKSPLFNSLEMLIEEQVGRDRDCPGGAGILRRADPADACRDPVSGVSITGSGGEHWCVNCHSPGDNLGSTVPPWRGRPGADPASRRPVRDLISERAHEGISCVFCHQVHGPVGSAGSSGYQGNPDWTSFVTGARFLSRPEDRRGLLGIANSGYLLDPGELLLPSGDDTRAARPAPGAPAVHRRPTDSARSYLASSEFCGSCHDVRLFGTDVLGQARRGEHFKRLRNAYSEWVDYASAERAAGKEPASCQGCHMSSYPGVCEPGDGGDSELAFCPKGMRFVAHPPGRKLPARIAAGSAEAQPVSTHYFAGVDLPLAEDVRDDELDIDGVDVHGIPLSVKRRRNLLLRASMRMSLAEARRAGDALEVPVELENVGAGHKIPAGFSQERELWVHLTVEDRAGVVLYEVGRIDRPDEDLRDKIFARVQTDPDVLDRQGRPIGLFGADVLDGPDVPRWSPSPDLEGVTDFRGLGLINFQNGFLRCVRCIGTIGPNGACEGRPGEPRAARYADGDYDLDTGECRSNLDLEHALFEIYFPVGALDADRGFVKGPDAIVDTRALRPGVPVRYTYVLPARGRQGPFRIRARLLFRSFPPFLVRAFADYERRQAERGRRPSGPLVTRDMLRRLEVVEMGRTELILP